MPYQPRWQQVGANAAEVYQQQMVPAIFAPWAPHLLDAAAVQLGEHALDVACGTGVVARLAAARVGSRGRVVGLDINPAMLAVARALPAVGGAPVAWLEADAVALPLPDAAFDVALCQQGLQQLRDRPAALRELLRVLRDGGRLAVSVWSRIEHSPGYAALVGALERHVGVEAAANRRAPFALGDANELRSLLTRSGFQVVAARTMATVTRFPSPEAFVAAQLAGTPLVTAGAVTAEVQRAIEGDVRAALGGYLDEAGLAVPMEAHIALARKESDSGRTEPREP
jgi:SAM-dependent methyltransferase